MAMTGFKLDRLLKNNARSLAAILMITVLLLTLTGCDLFESKNTTATTTSASTTTATTTTTTTTASTTATPTTSAMTTAPTTTAPTTAATSSGVTEQRMGFVISASATGTQSIRIDYVEFYTGDEAIAKAREDGSDVVYFDPALGRYVIDNDYYIRNNNPLIRTFPLSSGCLIKMLPDMGGSEPTDTVTYAELRTRLAERKRLMIINVVNGSVTWMEEFFTP